MVVGKKWSMLKLVVTWNYQCNKNSLKIVKNHLFQIFMTNVDTEKYLEFVHGVTSPPSLDYPVLAARLAQLDQWHQCHTVDDCCSWSEC